MSATSGGTPAAATAGEATVTTDTARLLEISGMSVVYRGRRNRRDVVTAVDGVSLDIGENETVGLVGESGSGKTTISRAVLGLTPVSAGAVRFEGEDITHASRRRRRALSRHVQVVFQDPYGSLSPTRTVGQTLAEPLVAHGMANQRHAHERGADMLRRVGLPAGAIDKFPSGFSGGQRQRIAIARALMPSPRLVICDEPVSALDLSVQAQVLNLLRNLQREYRLSYLFVAHNLAVVRHMAHRIVVLYRGQVMEQGPADVVYSHPGHPYTRALLRAVPAPDPALRADRSARVVEHTPTSARAADAAGGQGCPFATRCPHARVACTATRPPLVAAPGGSEVACIRAAEIPADAPVRFTGGPDLQ